MRNILLAMFMTITPASALFAQTIGDLEYTAHQDEMVEDTLSLIALSDTLGKLIHEYNTNYEMSEYDQMVLRLSAEDALNIIDKMRARGQIMFDKVQYNYEQSCLKEIPNPLPCSKFRETYRAIIADTLMLGTIFYIVTEESQEVLSALNE